MRAQKVYTYFAMEWHRETGTHIFHKLNTSEQGLLQEEVVRRRKKYGLNALPEAKKDSLISIFIRQFKNPIIYVLFVAGFIVFALNERSDGIIILAVLFFNAIVGTIQEGRAQNTLAALKSFVTSNTTVVRDGKEEVISASEVVPGDIILLQEGEMVCADARVIHSNDLMIDEAALTGESEAVHKISRIVNGEHTTIADQINMVFRGTYVMAGDGKAVVIATGLDTVVGKISHQIAAIKSEIPLQSDVRDLSRIILLVVGSISLALFLLGIIFGKTLREMFGVVVSLAVSLIPEGLPIVLTLILATGVWRMTKQHALVKRLGAVEALGQTTIIAIDKTGTLTKNEMLVQKVFINGNMFDITGNGYDPKGTVLLGNEVLLPSDIPELMMAGKISALSAKAHLSVDNEHNSYRVAGDPTEAALVVFGRKLGFEREGLEKQHKLIKEIPFNYNIKYHAVLHALGNHASEFGLENKGDAIATVIGAPEVLLDLCNAFWRPDGQKPFIGEEKKGLEDTYQSMLEQGLRVIAFAIAPSYSGEFTRDNLSPLTFVGFYGIKDSLRVDVDKAITKITSAGIRVVMITGDHKITAQAIGKEAGIFREGDEILTGQEIDAISDEMLSQRLDNVSLFARVTPEHKLRIIKAYQRRGEIIAMTGDGVNDAPSLVAADLGVAMGKIGTEVAKEASDIVLLDDNLWSIARAIEEGRTIYKTIKKVILYLFSTGMGEVGVIAGALLLGYPLPLLASQILWLNLVTDGFLDVALAMEPKEKGILYERWEYSKKRLIDSLMIKRMAVMAFPMVAGTLLIFKGYYLIDMQKAFTISLTILAVFQWFNAWNCRSQDKSLFSLNPFSNKFLVGATVIVVLLQLAAVYNPLLQKILHTTPLTLEEWLIIVPIAFSIIVVEEIRKFVGRAMRRKPQTTNYKLPATS